MEDKHEVPISAYDHMKLQSLNLVLIKFIMSGHCTKEEVMELKNYASRVNALLLIVSDDTLPSEAEILAKLRHDIEVVTEG